MALRHLLTFPLQLALMSDRAFPLALPGPVHLRNRHGLITFRNRRSHDDVATVR